MSSGVIRLFIEDWHRRDQVKQMRAQDNLMDANLLFSQSKKTYTQING
jgi:hypothetical protein